MAEITTNFGTRTTIRQNVDLTSLSGQKLRRYLRVQQKKTVFYIEFAVYFTSSFPNRGKFLLVNVKNRRVGGGIQARQTTRLFPAGHHLH